VSTRAHPKNSIWLLANSFIYPLILEKSHAASPAARTDAFLYTVVIVAVTGRTVNQFADGKCQIAQ
jgi:hypothetical protein